MAINLSKGQKLDLSKDSSLTQVRLCLGWDPIKTKGLFGRIKEKAVDLDASVIGYDAAGNLLEVVFYGSLRSVNGSIIHHGDNLTGAGEGDDEVIDINLPGVDARVAFLALVITSYSGDQFSNIDNAFVRVENVATRQEMARFSMTEKGSHTGLMVALLARLGRGWELRAIGDPLPGAARTPRDVIDPVKRYLV